MEQRFGLSKSNLIYFGIVAILHIALFVAFSQKSAYLSGELIGRLIALLLFPALFARLAWALATNKKRWASATFNVVPDPSHFRTARTGREPGPSGAAAGRAREVEGQVQGGLRCHRRPRSARCRLQGLRRLGQGQLRPTVRGQHRIRAAVLPDHEGLRQRLGGRRSKMEPRLQRRSGARHPRFRPSERRPGVRSPARRSDGLRRSDPVVSDVLRRYDADSRAAIGRIWERTSWPRARSRARRRNTGSSSRCSSR